MELLIEKTGEMREEHQRHFSSFEYLKPKATYVFL